MFQCVAVWCSVVQCSAVWHSVVQCGALWCSVVQCGAVWCSMLIDNLSVYVRVCVFVRAGGGGRAGERARDSGCTGAFSL